MRLILTCALLSVAFFDASHCAQAIEAVSGQAQVLDGDTVEIEGTRVRFAGIDAPETDQVCLDARGDQWACGVSARDALIVLAAGQPLRCDLRAEPDKYGRRLGTCFAGSVNVNEAMVRQGWALSYRSYRPHPYDADEIVARTSLLGLWSGSFHAPWDWRHHTCETTILGAYATPIDAREKLCPAAEAAPDPACRIKGNLRSKSGCIYHVEGDASYYKLAMSKPGHRWFCTVAEAEAAGCRRARR